MVLFGSILGVLLSLVLGLLALSMFLTGNALRGLVLLAAIFFLFSPAHDLIRRQTGKTVPVLIRIAGAAAMVGLFGYMMSRDKKTSIFFSPEVQAEMMAIYDAKLAQWPTPHESRFVDTEYGKVHVIISGPEAAPPVLLLNAGQMAGWSWMTNAAALNERYRTYAVDTIGEPGKSELRDLGHFPRNGEDWSELLTEITDALGIPKAYVVGASNGGFLALNYAIRHPERVEKIALLGAMGLTPSTNENIMHIAVAQMFPFHWLQEDTIRWSFGEDPALREQIDPWFYLVFQTAPQESPPVTMRAEELRRVGVPTLAVLGTRDNLMGDLGKVRELASNIPDVEIVEIDSSHLMGMEKPSRCNELILDFFGKS